MENEFLVFFLASILNKITFAVLSLEGFDEKNIFIKFVFFFFLLNIECNLNKLMLFEILASFFYFLCYKELVFSKYRALILLQFVSVFFIRLTGLQGISSKN